MSLHPLAQSSAQDMSQAVSLLTTTTGLIDIYFVAVHNQPDWILPQNLVLAVEEVQGYPNTIEWQGQHIPVHSLLAVNASEPAILLILEGSDDQQRIALLSSRQPRASRIRISTLHDTNDSRVLPYAYQKVMLEQDMYQVPDIDRLSQMLLSRS